jgi:signal transduction histidine kinase
LGSTKSPEQAPLNVQKWFTRVQRQVRRLSQLVEQLLDVSRLQSGMLILRPEPLELEGLTQEVLDGLGEDFQRAGCTVQLWSSGPVHGTWDRLRIEQVLTNLLGNAMRYGAGKPIEVELAHVGGIARIGVFDHGIGIEKESQERIFHRFERSVSTRHYGGLGLGLFITHQIVEAHHGAVRVESEPGNGARFWVDLPLESIPERPVGPVSRYEWVGNDP